MDQGKQVKQIENPLASVVAAQGVKLENLATGVDSAFSIVKTEINELRQSSSATIIAISKLSEQLLALTTAISSNHANAAPPAPAPVNAPVGVDPSSVPFSEDLVREPHIPSPRVFEGDLTRCCGFVTQCELVFHHNSSRFYSDDSKIAL